MKNIKRYHHFIIDGTGSIKLKHYIDSVEETRKIGSPNINPNFLPQMIKPKGIDAKRKWYLYKQSMNLLLLMQKTLPYELLILEIVLASERHLKLVEGEKQFCKETIIVSNLISI